MTIAIAIHGGAGVLPRAEMSAEMERAYRAALTASLDAGHAVLARGGSALDAVTAAVLSMEDDPLFNAGKGAAFTADGKIELDAAVMEGSTRNAGAVTGVSVARNPVLLARRVMENASCVMVGYAGADALARDLGLECVTPDYFYTQRRWDALQLELARIASGASDQGVPEDRRHGTIGAVALDSQGRTAAATSTGGRTAQCPGRIGDSPVIGAGTWADPLCAVSCTGSGEHFIRVAAAHDVAARMAYLGQTLQEACDTVIHQSVGELMGATGGLVAVDAQGHVAMPFHCEGMYRAMVDGQGRRLVAVYDA